jgi:hypothetical protein
MSNYNSITFIKRIVRSLLKDTLQSDGRKSYTYCGIAIFTIPDDFPDSTTIAVYKNGSLVSSSNWSYNSTRNTVTITSSLTTNDNILITYSYYDKYSDAELVDYIEASLAIFANYGYPRLFTLNASRDKVVTENGTEPTLQEVYQLCVITSINIDPRNIDIRTKEFSLSAEEKKSKSDLFGEAFQQFSSIYLGEFSFEPILDEDD